MCLRFICNFYLLAICVYLPVSSASGPPLLLEDKIRTMIAEKYKADGEYSPKLESHLLASDKQLEAICSNPELSFSGQTQRMSGNLTVLAKCGTKRHFVRVSVKATGRYWVAKHNIQPGQLIKIDDMVERKGSLDNLSSDLIFAPQQITDKIPTRMIKAGQPFTTSQLRKQWSVLAGEEVNIISIGSGFQILTIGKALDNAALNDMLRFRTRSGQLLTGKVTGPGQVTIKMQN